MLAYWREGLETPLADLDARVAENAALLRRAETPVLIVAGHAYDPAYSSWLRDRDPAGDRDRDAGQRSLSAARAPEAFADLLSDTGRWRRPGARAT